MVTAGKRLSVLAVCLAVLFGLAFPFARPAQASAGASPEKKTGMNPSLQGTSISLVSPAACPSEGCAPGQRLNYYLEFELNSYDASQTNGNVKVCLYTPTGWADPSSVTFDPTGGLTGTAYSTAAGCAEDAAPPTGYQMIGARLATVQAFAFGDSLNLAFRLSREAAASGKVLARVFEKSSAGWQRTQQSFTQSLTVRALPSLTQPVTAYAAASTATCDAGSYFPCYLNSRDDLLGGLGTGLKDAADALPDGSSIFMLGSYPIKSSTVFISKPVILDGAAGAGITYTGTQCAASMLLLTAGATVRNLEISDGSSCTVINRPLIEINSPAAVTIESNRLLGGDKAVWVRDSAGAVTVRFNQILNNAAHALYWDNGGGSAPLTMVANNIIGNGFGVGGIQVECGAGKTAPVANRTANHNFWGTPSAPDQATTHCTIASGKQLGAPIQGRSGLPGVQGQLVSVTTAKTYAFENQIAYQRTGGDADFGLYLINHGFANENFVPFTLNLGASPNPCSNYWDVFLPDGTNPQNTALELFIKYDKSPACIVAISSSLMCEQTTSPASYPLWWYDPATRLTDLWDTTGQKPAGSGNPTTNSFAGQKTTCRLADNEIQVTIDNDGRPALNSDLNYTPFMTGVNILRSFVVTASNGRITITWSTFNEADITGFYLLRGVDRNNLYPITDFIARTGDALSGRTYPAFIDQNRVNGTTYYYRLKIMRPDGNALYSAIEDEMATNATATITPSPTITISPTNTFGPTLTFPPPPPTRTRTPTIVPQNQPTLRPTMTWSPVPSRTGTPVLTLIAGTLTPTLFATPTFDGSITPGGTEPTNDFATQPPGGEGGYPVPTEPGEQGGSTPTAGGYPGPGDVEVTLYPMNEMTETAMAQATSTPTPATTQTAISGSSTGGPRATTPLASLATGFSIGMVLLGLIAAWFFVLRRRP